MLMEKGLLYHLQGKKKKKNLWDSPRREKNILNLCEGNILVLGFAWNFSKEKNFSKESLEFFKRKL